MSITKATTIAAACGALLLSGATVASAAGADHRGERTVCQGAWVEHGPADHPMAPAYRGDHFRITRATYATVHRTNGPSGAYDQHWARGVLTHRDARSHKSTTHRGWIRTEALGGAGGC
jgi:hypothetical protein